MTAELQAKIDTLEAEVARLRAHPLHFVCPKCNQVTQINPLATPLSAQEDVVERAAIAIAVARTGSKTPCDMDKLIAKTLSASGLLSTERERGLEK